MGSTSVQIAQNTLWKCPQQILCRSFHSLTLKHWRVSGVLWRMWIFLSFQNVSV